jgi:Flp pilus assembly protein TadG
MEINFRPSRRHGMRTTLADQRGAVLIIFALLLLVLIGFTALAMEAGRWYMVRAELSKSVDAAAIAGAKNISNPYADKLDLAKDFGRENFPTGYAGTPAMGTAGAVSFNAVELSDHRIQVTGSVTALAYLAQLFGVNQVLTSASGVAKKNEVEIMLVLDRSGSMGLGYGNAIVDLKAGAKSFVGFFKDTQDKDKLGMISFATGVKVDFPLGNNYVTPMTSAINNMSAIGATNAEDALAQSYGSSGLTDQTGVAPDKRVQQFVIFFTDGNPTAFRGTFKHEGTDNIDAVVAGTGQTCDNVYNELGNPGSETSYRLPNNSMVDPTYSGDGKLPPPGSGTSKCAASAPGIHSITPTTKWYAFGQGYPVAGYSDPEQCYIPYSTRQTLPLYICSTARQMTLAHAQTLKNRFVKIYIIGLGGVDKAFLHQIASGDAFEYYTPSSSDLQAIFNMIAKDIKLRLVQ